MVVDWSSGIISGGVGVGSGVGVGVGVGEGVGVFVGVGLGVAVNVGVGVGVWEGIGGFRTGIGGVRAGTGVDRMETGGVRTGTGGVRTGTGVTRTGMYGGVRPGNRSFANTEVLPNCDDIVFTGFFWDSVCGAGVIFLGVSVFFGFTVDLALFVMVLSFADNLETVLSITAFTEYDMGTRVSARADGKYPNAIEKRQARQTIFFSGDVI